MGSGNGDFSDYAETTVDPGAAMTATIVMVCIILFCCLPKCIAWSARCRCETENDDSSVISTDEDASHASRKSQIQVASPKKTGPEKCSPVKESSASTEDQQEGNRDDEIKKIDIPSGDIGDIEPLSPELTKAITMEDSLLMDSPKIAARILQRKGSTRTEMSRQRHKSKSPVPTKAQEETAASNKEEDDVLSHISPVSTLLDSRPALRLGRLRRASSKEQGDETQKNQKSNKADDAIHSAKKEAANDSAAINSYDSDDSANDSELSAYIDLSDLADGFDRLVKLAEWDKDMKSIWKTAKPFTTQAFIEGFMDLLSIGIIGHVFGVREANAYVVVMILNKLTNFINYGFYEGEL
jgi:hypothetical protein